MKKYLFISRDGGERSDIAAEVALGIAKKRKQVIGADSAPVPSGNANHFKERQLNEYDVIFVMEGWMKRRVVEQGYDGKVISFGIGNNEYRVDEPRLRRVLETKLDRAI
jgi:predicted protein tyrosine phosphatase